MGALPPSPRDFSHSYQNQVWLVGGTDSTKTVRAEVLVPGSALGSHPCGALSSAQAACMIATASADDKADGRTESRCPACKIQRAGTA